MGATRQFRRRIDGRQEKNMLIPEMILSSISTALKEKQAIIERMEGEENEYKVEMMQQSIQSLDAAVEYNQRKLDVIAAELGVQ